MIAAYGPWLLLATGAVGVVLGVDRTLKPRQQESKLLQVVSFLAGALLLAAPVGLVLQAGKGPAVSWVSILLMLALGICLTARAEEYTIGVHHRGRDGNRLVLAAVPA
jgi:hypothetical protein